MVKNSLGMFFILVLSIMFLVTTPAVASQVQGFDPFFLLMEYEFMLVGLLLGGFMIILSYFFIRRHMRES
ncbi:hypothetical protein SAMN04490247_1281 [Salimicrobium halophilum]|uniref:Uncharacterized protein n=1 Tax=Salimicrobium halophilum TaxID=86666 RepID=A0A1G8S6N5_9BACI|nr:hypothetical protein SAMN04490247_1281 [Salimicrobium halophilum]